MACLYGDGPEEEVLSLIRGFLRESKGRFKEKSYGRIIRFKTGLASSIIFVYNRSDSTFKICGDEKILEKLRNHIYTYRMRVKVYDYPAAQIRIGGGIEEQLSELLIERQILQNRIRACRLRGKILPVYMLISGLIIWYYSNNLFYAATTAILVGLILLLAPHPIMATGGIETCQITKLDKYKKELENIDKKLRNQISKLPEKHPLKTIVNKQLENKPQRNKLQESKYKNI